MPEDSNIAEPDNNPDPEEPSESVLLAALASQLLPVAGVAFLAGGLWRWPAGRPVAIAGAVLLALWAVLIYLGKGSWRLGE